MPAPKAWKPGHRSVGVCRPAEWPVAYGKPWKTIWLAPTAYSLLAMRTSPARAHAVDVAEGAGQRLVGEQRCLPAISLPAASTRQSSSCGQPSVSHSGTSMLAAAAPRSIDSPYGCAR